MWGMQRPGKEALKWETLAAQPMCTSKKGQEAQRKGRKHVGCLSVGVLLRCRVVGGVCKGQRPCSRSGDVSGRRDLVEVDPSWVKEQVAGGLVEKPV